MMASVELRTPARPRWQRELAEAVTDPSELLAILGLPLSLAAAAERASESFSLRVTRSFLARMRHGDPNDPLLRQVLPLGEELTETAGYTADPLEEGAARRAPQLLHKYTGRALLIATEACAIHCRYCFRREFPYAAPETRVGARWGEALEILAQDVRPAQQGGADPLDEIVQGRRELRGVVVAHDLHVGSQREPPFVVLRWCRLMSARRCIAAMARPR